MVADKLWGEGRASDEASSRQKEHDVSHPPVAQSVTWIYTEDLDATCRFYGQTLGLEQVLEQPGADGGGCRIFRHSPSSFLGVCRVRPGRWVEPKGVVITFVTPDIEGWHRYLLARGVTPEGPPSYSAAFNVDSFFAADPNGYKLEFQNSRDPAWPRG